VPHKVVPQAVQKANPQPGALSYCVRASSPLTHENVPGTTSA
jgi:hypothetical protein